VAQGVVLLALSNVVALADPFHLNDGLAHVSTMYREQVSPKVLPKIMPYAYP
jgi:hypothetical protein